MNDVRKTDKKSAGNAMPLRLFYTLLFYTFLSLVKLLSYMPFRMLYTLSDILYLPFYSIIRYRRKIVRKNLTESFPDKSLDEVIRLEKKFYHFFIDMMLETCKLLTISDEEMRKRMKFTNPEKLHKLLGEGKSVSVFLGHYGNWEWIASAGLWFPETTIAQIYRKLSNNTADELMKRLRERMGNVCVERHNTVHFMAKAKAENKQYIMGFLADQTPRRKEAKYFLRFLNHMVPVFIGTEKATKHYGYEALFIYMKRVKRGYYDCELRTLANNPKTLPDYELTSLYYKQLDVEIRLNPEFYLWSHNRFRNALLSND